MMGRIQRVQPFPASFSFLKRGPAITEPLRGWRICP